MMRLHTRVTAVALAVVVVLAGSVPLPAADFETPGSLRARDVLPKDMLAGSHYKIGDNVLADGFMQHFTVNSKFGTFEATGQGALRKLLSEIRGIASLREIKKTKAWATAVADSATSPFRFGKNLILHPVDTLTGVPKGAYKVLEETGEVITSERDPSDDPAYKKVLLMSGRKREYAAQLNVDPYSSNEVLQKELNSVAWAAAVGNLTVSAALLPVGGAAGAALSGVRWSNALNEYLKTEPAPRLRIINAEKFAAMKIPEDLAKQFLDHPHFTPRHDTILAEALAQLGGAVGRERLLERALTAQDEVEATFYTNVAQVLRGYHQSVAPITELQFVGGRVIVARARNGAAVVPLPIDYAMWTPATARRVDELQAWARGAGADSVELWLTGTVSPVAGKELASRGLKVTGEVGKRVEIID